MEEEVDKIISWIREYVLNSGAKGVVIGNSGGKDSATVIGLCVKALGKENVLAIAIPCETSEEDMKDVRLVEKTYNLRSLTVDITGTYKELERSINSKLEEPLIKDSKINIKPRLRMTTLYAIGQQYGYLVCGTGNLSEKFVGYTTKWGDSASDFNPIANFTVEEVRNIGRIVGVPEKIINKAPNDGLGSGTDEEKLGVTYKEIAEYIKTGKTEEKSQKIIEELHRKTEHKRKPIPEYIPSNKE